MTNLCKIGDILVSITHQNNPHFQDNIEKYSTDQAPEFHMESDFCDYLRKIEIMPYKEDTFRKFYRISNDEIIDVYSTSEIVKARIQIQSNHHQIMIQMIPRYFPNISDSEYTYFSMFFPGVASRKGYFILHASAICLNGRAFLFSAPSGGGKTTHSLHYRNLVDNFEIINDDLALIKDNFVYGSPFSGQSKDNHNISCEIAAVIFLHKGTENRWQRLDKKSAVNQFFRNMIRPSDEFAWNNVSVQCEQLITSKPFYSAVVKNDESSAKSLYLDLIQDIVAH